MSSHPEAEQLLRYADGELAARTAGRIRSHLEACWQCRAELEDLQNTVGACVRYRKNVLEPLLPPPPAPWFDVYQRFAAIDAARERARLLDRLAQVLQIPIRTAARWAPVAVALVVIGILFQQLRITPSVQAAELLRKAMAAADARPAKPRRIQLRTRQHRVTRLVGSPETATASLSSLQALFQAARYDWQDPLSARSYNTWREQLPDKRDEVMTAADSYHIRTTTRSGELMSATLKLGLRDFRPLEERLEFRNQEWVEISELPEEMPPSAVAAAKVAPKVEHIAAPPVPRATLGDELHVLAALHQVGADLGDPIEVSRSGSQVLVSGVGIEPGRRQQIQDALSSQAKVVVRFSEPAAPSAEPDQEPQADTPVNAAVLRLQDRLAQQLGGRASLEQLSAQVLDMSDAMMSRAYALRRLAERFPQEHELGAGDQQLLRDLRHAHASALTQQVGEIERVLKPVLAALGGAATPPVPAGKSTVSELFDAARRVETLLASLFGASPGQAPSEDLPSRLLSGMAELRATAETYDHIQQKE